jgi:excisionase family DNA binding protein
MSVEHGHDGIRLLNVRQAARYLGTTPKTLYTMAWRREIVFVKIGRSLRFDVKDLEQMIEKARVRPSQPTRGPDQFGRAG